MFGLELKEAIALLLKAHASPELNPEIVSEIDKFILEFVENSVKTIGE